MKKIHFSLLLSILIAFTSCSTQNMLVSDDLTQIKDFSEISLSSTKDLKIQIDDKISLSIWGHDDLSIGSIYGIYNSNEVYGKWVMVDKNGLIELPQIGAFKIHGLNTFEAADQLKLLFAQYIKDPVIVIKVLNREVTVLGEVKNEGKILLEKEENYLFDIIARAGGFEFYANKKDLRLIRGGKEKPVEYKIDLVNIEEYMAANIRLLPNDIIYVPSRKGKHYDKRSSSILPIASVLSTIAILISVAK